MALYEHDVVRAVTDLLVTERYRVRHEVPNMGQSVDIVASKGGRLTFVEAKVRNWRRAMSQCLAHEQVADFICVALCVRSVSETLLREVQSCGYGLIVCRPRSRACEWVAVPRRNTRVWAPQRRRLVSVLKDIEYAH